MASTASSRPTHYETLGILPTAPAHEIARAFAKQGSVFRPHAFGGLAELCIAYETLRDPDKRRAYDASLGVARDAKPKLEPVLGRMLASASSTPGPAPARPNATQDKLPSPIKPAVPLGPGLEQQVRPEPSFRRAEAPPPLWEDDLSHDVPSIDWRRAGIAIGAIVLAACALGGAAGWWSASSIEEQPGPTNSVSVPLPQARPEQADADPLPAPKPVQVAQGAEVHRATPAKPPVPVIEQEPIATQSVANDEPPRPDLAEANIDEPAGEEAASEPTAASTMPLPNRVIARTIDRIGYSCGQVAAIAPIEGHAAGVHKVTCTSGQSFQATPVNGRYRFRRLGGR